MLVLVSPDNLVHAPPDDLGDKGHDGVAERVQSVLVVYWSSSSRSVHPSGKPIIHSTNRGWRLPPFSGLDDPPRITSGKLGACPLARRASGSDAPLESPSLASGVGNFPIDARP